jgi:hypothetical protein
MGFMSRCEKSALMRRLVIVLYALAVVMVGFGSSAHAHRFAAQTGLSVGGICESDTAAQHKSTRHCGKHCEFCTLNTASGLEADLVWTPIRRVENRVRVGFLARAGRELDGRPVDLRSRAPPTRG